ncbi:MAG TPA: hypothetical protein VH186_09920 [Chloroflexia bacterium]|nr:hypothetical protein [Chloroflexia bacterium]
MRCPSCGYENVSQALECSNCRKFLDPIAALVTVTSGQEAQPQNQNLPVANTVLNLTPTPLPVQPIQTAEEFLPSKYKPAKRQIISPDPEFLAESDGASNLIKLAQKFGENVGPTLTEAKCSRCKRVVERNSMVLAPAGKEEMICKRCEAKIARKIESAPLRQKRIQMLGGFLLGAIAAGVLMMYSKWYGLSATQTELNWQWAAFIGLIIAVAVRIGSLNRPSFLLQGIAVVLTILTQFVFLYACLNALNRNSLTFGDMPKALQAAGPGVLQYGFIGLGILLAIILPSALVFGRKETVYTVSD